jgi:hypothetical protein
MWLLMACIFAKNKGGTCIFEFDWKLYTGMTSMSISSDLLTFMFLLYFLRNQGIKYALWWAEAKKSCVRKKITQESSGIELDVS